MTDRRHTPLSALPFALTGLLVGVGLIVLAGQTALERWETAPTPSDSSAAVIQGTVEWAGWRRTARADGPVWFLQIRLAQDPHGFLVVPTALTTSMREQLRRVGPRENGKRLPPLEGRRAVLEVASRFQEAPRSPTPYIRALRIDGTPVLSARPEAGSATFWRYVGDFLLGTGLLVGLGLTGVSLHHVFVCGRYSLQSPS